MFGLQSLARLAMFAVVAACFASSADAAYPDHAVTLVVPFPPGGGTDIVARLLASKLSGTLGQPVIVENKAGAGSVIGTGFVAHAAADGYTLLLASNSALVVGPLFLKTNFDPVKDFTPICQMASSPFVLSAAPSLPAHDVKELIALAKAHPGTLNMASFGTGSSSHILGEMFQYTQKIDLNHVPYKGSVPAITDLMADRVQVMFDVVSSVLPYYKTGKVKILGITGTKPSPALPGVPLVSASVPGFEANTWFGVVAPHGVSAAIVERLNADILKALADPEVKKIFDQQALDLVGGTPAQFATVIQGDVVKWGKMIRETGVHQ